MPVREFTSIEADKQQPPTTNDDESESDTSSDRVGLKEPDEVGSGSLQHPHDDEATYRRKDEEDHFGYKSNLAETCGGENPFRVITAVRTATNNTPDGELLAEDVPELPQETDLSDLLVDGGYVDHDVEALCQEYGIAQHFSGIPGESQQPIRSRWRRLNGIETEWLRVLPDTNHSINDTTRRRAAIPGKWTKTCVVIALTKRVVSLMRRSMPTRMGSTSGD